MAKSTRVLGLILKFRYKILRVLIKYSSYRSLINLIKFCNVFNVLILNKLSISKELYSFEINRFHLALCICHRGFCDFVCFLPTVTLCEIIRGCFVGLAEEFKLCILKNVSRTNKNDEQNKSLVF